MRIAVTSLICLLVLVFHQNCDLNDNRILESECEPYCDSFVVTEKAIPILPSSTQLKIDFDSEPTDFDNFAFRLELDTGEIFDLDGEVATSSGCVLQTNPNFLRVLEIIESQSFCRFEYEFSGDVVTCMAFAIPYAKLVDPLKTESHLLSGKICNQVHTSVCGSPEIRLEFSQKVRALAEDLNAGNCE